MPTTPDLSAPGTTPYHDANDDNGQPLPQQAYNGSKDVHGLPICAPAPFIPGNAPEVTPSPTPEETVTP